MKALCVLPSPRLFPLAVQGSHASYKRRPPLLPLSLSLSLLGEGEGLRIIGRAIAFFSPSHQNQSIPVAAAHASATG